MKKIHTFAMAVALGLTLATAQTVSAQTAVSSTTTTTTNTAGTISEFSPSAIVVRTEAAQPVRYTYTKTTTYVDEAGNPVSMETVKSGLPVTVYYTHDGDNMVATKVVVRKAVTTTSSAPAVVPAAPVEVEKKTTTTTTTEK